ncbi:aldo/keto reductase [Konateibacter massiliensis]|uniref:aldo/keto reductase n=1 Tax=Konateibacter massiliensis TaxID=2002841 RepID=UPI000C15D5DB|nr:aldo/keto reductase [Konateibacter massiliensis]
MNYRKFGTITDKISALGFGAMRLPVEGEDKHIDEAEAIKMIRHAIDSGVNYVDTAYPYHAGESEIVVGKALQDGYREKTYLATKCPVWEIQKEEDFERILDEQLSKLQTEKIDFYLLHALDKDRLENKIKKFNLIWHMEEAKKAGKISYIGFSFHDELPVFKEIVDCYDKWDFCQIQFNYINTDYQAGLEGLKYAAGKGIGVVIMEPLLGGRLANPYENVAKVLPAEKQPVEAALDYIWNYPEVALLLSGMSTMEQLEDNLTYASRSGVGMLSESELRMYDEAKRVFDTQALVRCTKCAYCMPCPASLNIPEIFEVYNKSAVLGEQKAKELYEELEVKASECLSCRHCESECPQHIMISEVMKDVSKVLQTA